MHDSNSRPANPMLTWLHIGDLHMVTAGAANARDLRAIVQLTQGLPDGNLDFVVLPGDNADDGTSEQFALVRDALAPLRLPVHIIPGDHDFQCGSLRCFHGFLQPRRLPYSVILREHRCLFLDVVSAGKGGPDFRLAEDQLDWVEREVTDAANVGQIVAVFMHTYPADLQAGAERLLSVLRKPNVLSVDMGHTHYNEVANDGTTIFMATRSTGQIEEGPAGFSIAALDGNTVSWRFKPLDRAWPWVQITSPPDHRLHTVQAPLPAGCPFVFRAKVLGDRPIQSVEASIDDAAWQAMNAASVEPGVWTLTAEQGHQRIRVRARDEDGRVDEDVIEIAIPPQGISARVADGSDADRVQVWPERGILGTQLGPNRNGHPW